MVEPGWACIGLAVWAKLSVVCNDTISPAVARALMNMRSKRPIIRPTTTSRMIHPTINPMPSGRPGSEPRTTGHSARLMTKASDSRTRGGT